MDHRYNSVQSKEDTFREAMYGLHGHWFDAEK